MDLENLNILIRKVATLIETDAVVISCYVNIEAGRARSAALLMHGFGTAYPGIFRKS